MGEFMAQQGDLGHPWGAQQHGRWGAGMNRVRQGARPRLQVQPINHSLEVQRGSSHSD